MSVKVEPFQSERHRKLSSAVQLLQFKQSLTGLIDYGLRLLIYEIATLVCLVASFVYVSASRLDDHNVSFIVSVEVAKTFVFIE